MVSSSRWLPGRLIAPAVLDVDGTRDPLPPYVVEMMLVPGEYGVDMKAACSGLKNFFSFKKNFVLLKLIYNVTFISSL